MQGGLDRRPLPGDNYANIKSITMQEIILGRIDGLCQVGYSYIQDLLCVNCFHKRFEVIEGADAN